MIEDENLQYFITEDLFLVNEPAMEYEQASAPVVIAKEEVTAPVAEMLVQNEAEVVAPKSESPITTEPEKSASQPQETIHELVVLVLPMNNQDKELLNNLLKAINKSNADIKLIDSFSDFKENFKILLSFGYLNELKHQMDGSITPFSWFKKGTHEILISAPLSSLHNNIADKAALWNCLKARFVY